MNTLRKLTASILIVCMFVRLPESEVMASETADALTPAATSVDYTRHDATQADCTGIYSIFSPCSTLQIYPIDSNGDESPEMHYWEPRGHTLFNDEDRILPWEDDSEEPQIGFMIPIVHF